MGMAEMEGRIIEYLDGDELKMGLVTVPGKSKLQLIDERGRNASVQPNRVVVVHQGPTSASEFPHRAAELRAQIESALKDLDIELLWESVRDQADEWTVEQLAENYFGDRHPVHLSALFRALMDDTLYFKRKGHSFAPKTLDQVREQQTALQRRQEKEQWQQRARAWIEQVLSSEGRVDAAPDMVPLVSKIEDFLLRKNRNDAVELLDEAGEDLTAREVAFDLLVKTGRLEPDADPLLVIAGIEDRFPSKVMERMEALAPFAGDGARTDFTTLTAFSIDDEDTREVDDALTVEFDGDRVRLGIHIADVSYFVDKADVLDEQAFRRSVTLYLPTRSVMMLPERLACDVASLNHGQLRPTMSFEVTFDEGMDVLDWQITRGQIRVDHRLNYDQADAMIESSDDGAMAGRLKKLHAMARRLLAQRAERGAIIIRRPELKIRVKDDHIQFKIIDPGAPGRVLVSEMMILANRIAAQYATRHAVPIIFRAQDPPSRPPADSVSHGYDPVEINHLLKRIKRSRFSLSPQAHAGLGLDAYTQLTSPIRRFADLVIQRQMAAHLAGGPLRYEHEELLEVLVNAEAAEREMRGIERSATQRWALEYLNRHRRDDEFEAVVIEKVGGGYVVELGEVFIRGYLSTTTRHEPGDRCRVTIGQVHPEQSKLRLKETERPPMTNNR
jgi:exoribonuclease-2